VRHQRKYIKKGRAKGEKNWGICFKCFAKTKFFFCYCLLSVFAFWGQQTNGKKQSAKKEGQTGQRKREFPKLIKTS